MRPGDVLSLLLSCGFLNILLCALCPYTVYVYISILWASRKVVLLHRSSQFLDPICGRFCPFCFVLWQFRRFRCGVVLCHGCLGNVSAQLAFGSLRFIWLIIALTGIITLWWDTNFSGMGNCESKPAAYRSPLLLIVLWLCLTSTLFLPKPHVLLFWIVCDASHLRLILQFYLKSWF